MEDFERFIRDATQFLFDKLYDLIHDDEHWLKELGVDLNDKSLDQISREDIIAKLVDPTNLERADKVIEYIIGEYLIIDNDGHSIFWSYASASSYTRISALYVFKLGDNYFCYYYPDDSLITEKDPLSYCKDAAASEISQYEMEEKNMDDEYFKDSGFSLSLDWNFELDSDLNQ